MDYFTSEGNLFVLLLPILINFGSPVELFYFQILQNDSAPPDRIYLHRPILVDGCTRDNTNRAWVGVSKALILAAVAKY